MFEGELRAALVVQVELATRQATQARLGLGSKKALLGLSSLAK